MKHTPVKLSKPLGYLVMLLFLGSCIRSLDSVQEIGHYVNDENNGLIKQRRTHDLNFTLKYIPPEYFYLNEVSIEGQNGDYREQYSNGLTFHLNISPSGNQGKVLYRGISSKEELKERIAFLNFRFGSLLELQTGDGKITPHLCMLENAHTLSDGLNFLMVFSKDQIAVNEKVFTVKYVDLVFDTGIHQFKFEFDKIENIPEIKI